ncbi:MAG: FAD-dependent oxidoreductase [Eubacteriales bacterium]
MFDPLPPCTNACPVNTDVRGYLYAIARRDYSEAYRLIRANNPFPSVCAWICPHPCEDACRRGSVDGPLSIRLLKRFAVESAGASAGETMPAGDTGKKVAVVGAGPAGLTAAYDLVRNGHRVTVYDRHPLPGGHFLTSLPTYRLPREALKKDVEEILKAGVELRNSVEVGRDVTIEQLKSEFDAVVVSAGLWAGRTLKLPGFDHPDVLSALPFLKAANTGEKPKLGNRVIVIGGGDVAMDVARTSLRLGVHEVKVTCLEPREQMPAHYWEIKEAAEEGVELLPGYGPVEILIAEGTITGIYVQKIKSVFDEDMRFNPIYEPGVYKTVPGDTVILAIGQLSDNSFLAGSGLGLNGRNCLAVDGDSLMTSLKGIFACGEIVTGPGPAIAAVASGHRAAAAVEWYLTGKRPVQNGAVNKVIGPLPAVVADQVPGRERAESWLQPPSERKNSFLPFEAGLSESEALGEAVRCLTCGMGARVIKGKCVACLTCLRVCPYGVPVVSGRAEMPAEGCQACGICAAACPAGAISVATVDEQAVLDIIDTPPFNRNKPAIKSETVLPANRITIFSCRGTCFGGSDLDGIEEATGLEYMLVELPTVGALRLEWILRAFENGTAGVAVVACKDGNCLYEGGPAPLAGVIDRARRLLGGVGISPGRLCYCRPGEGEDTMSLLAGFARKVLSSD